MKTRARLTVVLNQVKREAAPNGVVRDTVVMARHNPEIASVIKGVYRTMVADAFPGCRVEFGARYVYLWLPKLYPNSELPIVSVLEPIHMEVFNPKGGNL